MQIIWDNGTALETVAKKMWEKFVSIKIVQGKLSNLQPLHQSLHPG